MGKIIGWFVVAAMAAGVYLWQPEFFQHAYGIIETGDIAALAE